MGKECGRKECPVSTKVKETEISGLVFFLFVFIIILGMELCELEKSKRSNGIDWSLGAR